MIPFTAWEVPLEEKRAVYWTPPEKFDFATGGRALSHEELKILGRLEKDIRRPIYNAHFYFQE